MSAPLYRDPVEDGTADPVLIRHRRTGDWWMFYTNRRPRHEGPGKQWVHGTRIGVAVSQDRGRSWTYRGTVEGLDPPGSPGPNTHWAPEIIHAGGRYHMYLTYIDGVPSDWNHPRQIVHLTSPDLERWTRHGPLALGSDRAIDAAVARCPDGRWRLWFKNERDGSSTWSVESEDLFEWRAPRRVIPGKPDHPAHEGPNVFELGGHWWMITDEWRGQAVHRSADTVAWERQGLILDRPGADPQDHPFPRHADVVVAGDHALICYFTHPGRDESGPPSDATFADRRTAIHVGRLWVEEGRLMGDRDVEGALLPDTDI